MTAPTINGTRYPQPVEELLPAAREVTAELGKIPSRNRLMRTYRIGAAKADELRERLVAEAEERAGWTVEQVRGALGLDQDAAEKVLRMMAHKTGLFDGVDLSADPWLHAEPIGPDPEPTDDIVATSVGEPPWVPAPRGSVSAVIDRSDAPPSPAEAIPDTQVRIDTDHVTKTPEPAPVVESEPLVETVGHPGTTAVDRPARKVVAWPVILLAMPAFVAVWSGWVGLGGLTGFGVVHPLPGIWDDLSINTAITLPIGVETYGAFALYVWLSGRVPARARRFAKWSALGSLAVGALGQVAYHLLVAAGITVAPWWITTAVSVLPVAVLGMGAALAHLVREGGQR